MKIAQNSDFEPGRSFSSAHVQVSESHNTAAAKQVSDILKFQFNYGLAIHTYYIGSET